MIDLKVQEMLEDDVLRWLVMYGLTSTEIMSLAILNLKASLFSSDLHKEIFLYCIRCYFSGDVYGVLPMVSLCEKEYVQKKMLFLCKRKLNESKKEVFFKESIARLLESIWMEERELIKERLQSGNCGDKEAMDLARRFDELKTSFPKIKE